MTDKVFDDKKRFLQQVQKDLDRHIVGLSEQLLKTIIDQFVSQLDRQGDAILNTPKNIQLIAAIDKVYQRFMDQNGGGIAKRIADGAQRVMGYNVDYYSQFSKGKAAYKNTTEAVQKIIDGRLGIGDKVKLKEGGYMDSLLKDTTARNAIKNLSYREVIKGSGFKGFKKGLEKLIVGDEERYGAFRQHYRNYAYDSFVQVDRDQSMLLAKDLDLEFFVYEGTVIDSSREFCIKRAGNVYSMEEAKEWVNDPWIKRNLERGYITSYDPIADMGLFGCRHIPRFVPRKVAEAMRPDLRKPNTRPAGKEVKSQFSNISDTIQSRVSNALSAIDMVHGDGDLLDIPIERERSVRAGLQGSLEIDRNMRPVKITLNPKGLSPELTVVHEMGHYFDVYSIGEKGGFESKKKDGLLRGVMEAAEISDSVKKLKEILAAGVITVSGKELPLAREHREFFRYLLQPHEIFARAYAQFVAKRNGSEQLKEQLSNTRDFYRNSNFTHQWEDDDFLGIENAMEEAMVKMGWMKKDD